MIDVAILGSAHPHVRYVVDEVARREDCRLVAVAEPDPLLLSQYLPGWDSTPTYRSAHELLANHDVDVAFICGVYSQRADDVLAALGAGAHVIADKPLCTSLDQLELIESAARKADRQVSIAFEKRFYPSTIAARRIVEDGVLGDLALIASTGPHRLNPQTRPAWFFRREDYGGVAADLAVHDIDLVLQLSGATRGTVSAAVGASSPGSLPSFEDHAALLLRAGRITATIDAHWLSPLASPFHGRYRMRPTGTQGTAELDWARNTVTVETHTRAEHEIALPPGRPPTSYFFDAIIAGLEPEISTAQSVLATRVALTAQQSAEHEGRLCRWGEPATEETRTKERLTRPGIGD